MTVHRLGALVSLLAGIAILGVAVTVSPWSETVADPQHRPEVVFWHFWGGADRETVDDVVRRFNQQQSRYFVRAMAMPGSNLDVKLFLAVTGGDPPDVVNQDDPIVADWASRGAIVALDSVANQHELSEVERSLFPAARELGMFEGKLFALCNGLDVRALYYDADTLQQLGLPPPETIEDLDRIAEMAAPTTVPQGRSCFGFLPNPRNLWCWGYVFGGRFYDPHSRRITLDNPGIVAAMEWMAGYGRRYGSAAIALRARDQSLPGKSFSLLTGRYVAMVDGQWRIRDIELFQSERTRLGLRVPRFGVCPLPHTAEGPTNAGWINGNVFVIPAGAKNKRGAWEFMKFWSGLQGHAAAAATSCIRGGWIPVTQQVVAQPAFQAHLARQPLWNTFLTLAGSAAQQPRPNIRAALKLDREVRTVAERAMYGGSDICIAEMLKAVSERLNAEAK